MTVGFEIDLVLCFNNLPLVASLVSAGYVLRLGFVETFVVLAIVIIVVEIFVAFVAAFVVVIVLIVVVVVTVVVVITLISGSYHSDARGSSRLIRTIHHIPGTYSTYRHNIAKSGG